MTVPSIKIMVTLVLKIHLVHGVEATENQAINISVAWKIKRLVKQFYDILYDFQFGRQHQTCLSAIILKQITIDSFILKKTWDHN
jgi:hypothetical protein